MERYIIKGGNRLSGCAEVQGAKNSALPILAATVLVNGECVIHNCPDITDVDATVRILRYLGCRIKREGHTLTVDSSSVSRYDIPDSLMRQMRSSVIFLGAIIGRAGMAEISAPGGCEIGLRPIDLHLSAIQKFGVQINEEFAKISFKTLDKLTGCPITLSFPSVGATENIILTAVTASGRTIIRNAAREPEISDLADFLNACGAKISGAGESTVVIDGVPALHSAEHTVIPDRIVAGTYMSAAAVTGGRVTLEKVTPVHLMPIIPLFEEAGCRIDIGSDSLTIAAPARLKSIRTARTMPYPGFPTDMQAPLMAVMMVCRGTGVIIETVFESRYKHVSELLRFGARIRVDGRMAVIDGVERLTGASVITPDLRGGSAFVVAGLCAEGETSVENIKLINRGYENLHTVLAGLGADIKKGESYEPESNE